MIDADTVLYSAATASERALTDGPETIYLQVRSLDQTYDEVCSRLESLVNDVKADDGIICLTPTASCFRYAVLPTYKGNRKGMRRPAQLLELQKLLFTKKPFTVLAVRGLEADDVCGISSGNLQAAHLKEPVVVSIDKDLGQIPGLLYSWSHPELGIREISEADGDRLHMLQTLTGDTVDNYTGCPKVGAVKAERFLQEHHGVPQPKLWASVVALFKKYGYNEEYALTQARVARILRHTDWNQDKKEVRLWSPYSNGAGAQSSRKTAHTSSHISLAMPLPKPGETLH